MRIDIWSDIMCPFCYIGKRRLENALDQFPQKDQVEVVWHSYQLDPELQHVPGQTINEMLAQKKGWSVQQAKKMNDQVVAMANEVNLNYDLDKAIPANTFDAHRLIHLAAKHHLQDQAKEQLLAAYFTAGKNVGDAETLVQIGTEIGLPETEIREMLASNKYANEVLLDGYQAQQMGISGVPFFVLNQKYGISGAQPSEAFLQALNKVWDEEKPAIVSLNNLDENGAVCSDGVCTD